MLLAKLLPGHVSAGYGANDEKAGTQMVEILGTFAPVEVVNQIVGALCRSFVDPRLCLGKMCCPCRTLVLGWT